jgi:hypothetical protein
MLIRLQDANSNARMHRALQGLPKKKFKDATQILKQEKKNMTDGSARGNFQALPRCRVSEFNLVPTWTLLGRYSRYQPSDGLVVDARAPLHWPLGASGGLIIRGAWGSLYGGRGASPVDATTKDTDKVSLPGHVRTYMLSSRNGERAAATERTAYSVHWIIPVCSLGLPPSAQTIGGLYHRANYGSASRCHAAGSGQRCTMQEVASQQHPFCLSLISKVMLDMEYCKEYQALLTNIYVYGFLRNH